MGTAVTLTTYQFAQVLGFAAGGAVAGFFGTRWSLVIDAATFAASALIVRTWVRSRPAPAADGHHETSRLAGIIAGARLVFARPALRTPMLFGWLAAFYNAPEGVVTPLARDLHGGAAAVGVILAATALGETAGAIVFSRFVAPPTRLRLMGPLAVAACGVPRPVLLAARPARLAADLVRIGSVCFLPDRRERRLRERGAARAAQPGLRPSAGWYEPGPGNSHDPGGCRRGEPFRGPGHCDMRRCWRRSGAGDRSRLGSRLPSPHCRAAPSTPLKG